MKLLIVDDEPSVREGLKKIIDWESFGFSICGEASDGSEAIEKIMSLSPELVILDIKMPEIHGTEVAQIARKEGFNGKFIMLSGFSDFEYAKKAIQSGVSAYLLKPIDKDELSESVVQARKQIEEEEILSIYGNQNLNTIRHNFLCDVITGKIEPDNNGFHAYNIQLEGDIYQLVYVNCESSFTNKEVLEKFQSIYRNLSTDCVLIDEKVYMLLKGRKSIFAFLESFKYTKFDFLNAVTFILSSTINNMREIPELYLQLKRTDEKKFFYDQGEPIIDYAKLQIEKTKYQSMTFDIASHMEKLYDLIASSDTERITELLYNLETYFSFNEDSSDKVVRILINYYAQTKDLLVNAFPQLADNLPEDTVVINQIYEKATLHEIINLLSLQFNRMIFFVNAIGGNSAIQRIKQYIDINYAKALRLESIANMFGYNSSYLGKLFKNEIGENFNSYLDKIRIEKSKELLLKGSKVSDAAVKCGFNDMNYFAKKFKKYVSCSPGNFRNTYYRDENSKKGIEENDLLSI